MPVQPFIEVAFGVYFTGTVLYALAHGIYGTLPFLMLFQFGFLYTGLMSISSRGGEDMFVKAPETASGNRQKNCRYDRYIRYDGYDRCKEQTDAGHLSKLKEDDKNSGSSRVPLLIPDSARPGDLLLVHCSVHVG